VLERLTSSSYIMPIYGFCGTSMLAPLAGEGNLWEVMESTRRGGKEFSPMDKLKVGVQIADGLAALHDIDKDGQASFAHNDLDISQFVYRDGRFLLNDFNLGRLLKKNRYDNSTCKGISRLDPWLYRAPEDLAENDMYGGTGPFLMDKADVFSLGAALYIVLTKKWMWNKRPAYDFALLLIKGERPPFPKEMLTSDDNSIQAMMKAIHMCWKHDPKERSTAQEVARFLNEEFIRLVGAKSKEEAFDLLRVDFPTLIEGRDTYHLMMNCNI
jgi:hypothetical protein